MCSITKIQKSRERFLYQLLEYDSDQKEFNPHFFKVDMLKRLGADEGEFNKIQKCLGDQYCSYVDNIDGKDRYAIHTSNCWILHDKFEDWKLSKSLKSLTIVLMVIAVLTLIVALPSAIDTCLRFVENNKAQHTESTTSKVPDKPLSKEIKQKASNLERDVTKPEKTAESDKLIKKDERSINEKANKSFEMDSKNAGLPEK